MAQSKRKKVFKSLKLGDLVLFSDCASHRPRSTQQPIAERLGLITKIYRNNHSQLLEHCVVLCPQSEQIEMLRLDNFIRLLSPATKE